MAFPNSNVASMMNYFNNLINNQIAQSNFSNTSNVNQQQPAQSTSAQQVQQQATSALNNVLNSLSGLLNGTSSQQSLSATSSLSSTAAYMADQLVAKGASIDKVSGLIDIVLSNTGDIAYTRTGANDPNITLQNRIKVFGQDLQSVLNQATNVVMRGGDINKYLDQAINVSTKGDYDDLRRFISVGDTVLYRGESLDKYYDFVNEVLDKRHYDMESNAFSLQTMLSYGANMDDSLKVMRQMENTGLTGRNNMVDLNRVIIDARNKGAYIPYIVNQIANSGDTRAFMDNYMANNGLQTTAPDFNKFKRIERIDGEDMIIKQGESAALFSQAISNYHGLLPESVLHWSSLQTGAISNGSSYLDLSKLKAGTYDIYVKIGPGYGGTDTAYKRVVILPPDDENCDNKDNNGLGDTKDGDNTTKGIDTSNPGHNTTTPVVPPVVTPPVAVTPPTTPVVPPVATPPVVNPSPIVTGIATPTITKAEIGKDGDFQKLQTIASILKNSININTLLGEIDKKKPKEVETLFNDLGLTTLSDKYKKQSLQWDDLVNTAASDKSFYTYFAEELKTFFAKEDLKQYLTSKFIAANKANTVINTLDYSLPFITAATRPSNQPPAPVEPPVVVPPVPTPVEPPPVVIPPAPAPVEPTPVVVPPAPAPVEPPPVVIPPAPAPVEPPVVVPPAPAPVEPTPVVVPPALAPVEPTPVVIPPVPVPVEPPVVTPPAPAQPTFAKADVGNVGDFEKIKTISSLIKSSVNINSLLGQIDKKKPNEVDTLLNNLGLTNLSNKYKSKTLQWDDLVGAASADKSFYTYFAESIKSFLSKDELKSYLNSNFVNNSKANAVLNTLDYTLPFYTR